MEKLGLNGCLVDDMGFGKIVEVIVWLVVEKGFLKKFFLILLIVFIFVVGNW